MNSDIKEYICHFVYKMTLKDNGIIMYMTTLLDNGLENKKINGNSKTTPQYCENGLYFDKPSQRYQKEIDNNLKRTSTKTKQKKLKKVTVNDFKILKYEEHYDLLTKNYNVKQLKEMCKHYKLKMSGTKDEFISRLYSFLRGSYFCNKIQKTWRLHLIRKLNALKGPALTKRTVCVNETDFLTMDNLKEVSIEQFYSYRDDDNVIYGFDITSLYNLFLKSGNKTPNPYNRKIFPDNTRNDINSIIKLSTILGIDLVIAREEDNISPNKKQELRSVTLFDNIDSLGNLTNHLWFWNLERITLIRFLRELHDIWAYRANLSLNVKREICPPVGDPFRGCNLAILPSSNIIQLRKVSLDIMENLVNRGINNGSKCLGAYYVLSALTLVNQEVANALPWLYESVVYN